MIKFNADKIKIKPPNIADELKVELTTGIYAINDLKEAFIWQAEQNNYEVIIRKLDK